MQQIITEEAAIIYDPIETTFDVQPIGGKLNQRQNSITGEYSPDRTITPMVLMPSLQVKDTNKEAGQQISDETENMTVQWFRVYSNDGVETEEEITDVYDPEAQAHEDLELYGKGLMVNANTPAGEYVEVRIKASFVNPNTLEVLRFKRGIELKCDTYIEFNPSIEVNIPNYSIVDPFKITDANKYRSITAKFFAGADDITSNQNVTFLWEKLDGTTYRTMTNADVEVMSVSRNVMVINQECVGRCKYRVTAWHTGYAEPENRRSFLFTINRQMSGATPTIQITRGKFLKSNIEESEAKLVVSVNSSELSNPEKFFVCKWSMYRQNGTTQEGLTYLGWGMNAIAGRSVSGYDRTKVPTFKAEVYSLSEYQLCTDDNGDPVTDDNGGYITGQVIEHLNN